MANIRELGMTGNDWQRDSGQGFHMTGNNIQAEGMLPGNQQVIQRGPDGKIPRPETPEEALRSFLAHATNIDFDCLPKEDQDFLRMMTAKAVGLELPDENQ